jgi:hypothetical protein
MGDTTIGLRDIRRHLQRVLDPPPAEDPPEERERRIVEHEKRIHNHPCPCGSGKTYGSCCLLKINQEFLELRHRQRMGIRDEDL